MTLQSLIDEAETRRKTLRYFAPEVGDFVEQFDARNVVVRFERLSPHGPDPVVIIEEGGEFRGAMTVESLRTFLWPPIRPPHDLDALSPAYRAVFELLDDTVFASLSRRQLLATSREFEDRAWRTGHGTLHVGFQSLAAFEEQRSLYVRMAEATSLDVHVHAAVEEVDADLESLPLTVHTESDDELGRFWFVVFDGGGDPGNACALVAEQRTDETFYPALVSRAIDAVR